MKKLITNYSFWTGLAGAVGILAVSIAKLFGVTISADGVEEIIMSICGILIVFGIVPKPAKSKEKLKNKNHLKEENIIDNKEINIKKQ